MQTLGPTGIANHQPDRVMSVKVPADRPRRAVPLDDLTAGTFDGFLVTGALAPVDYGKGNRFSN